MDALRTTESLARTFSFYTTPSYRFHNEKLMDLTARFGASDNARFPVDAPDQLARLPVPHPYGRFEPICPAVWRIPAATTASESLPVRCRHRVACA